jgi:hypothetical protein
MINANQITSRLRMMSDQELQRFAEMHKQDPYMFPLAFNESNMRKEMRSAPQGQGAAPQAPVNQQALAAMQPAQLPEDQGIGALNPNMQFADGGLVAFAGGGEAGPYARADDRDFGTGGVAYADGGAIRFQNRGNVPGAEYWPTNMYERTQPRSLTRPSMRTDYRWIGENEIEEATKRLDAQRAKEDQNPEEYYRHGNTKDAARLKQLPAAPPAPDMPGTTSPSVNKPPLPTDYATRTGGGASMPPLPTSPGGPGAAQPSAGLSAIPRAPAGAAPGAPDDSFVKNIRKVYADAEEAQAKRDAQREMEYLANRPESESFKERKAALEEDRADVEKESRMNEGLAWLTFASKVVQPGKNTIQALVEGASAGGEQYSRAQKELKKAEKERKMGLASLAEAERAAKAGDFEKAQARRDAMATRSENSLNAQVAAVAAAYGITHKEAHDMLLAQMQITSQERIAAAGNATTIQAAKLRSDAEDRADNLRYAAAQAKLGAEDVEGLMKFAQANPLLKPQEAVEQYRAMRATFAAMNKASVSETPPPVIRPPKP